MAKVVYAYRVDFACEKDNGSTVNTFVNGICGPNSFAFSGAWVAKYASEAEPLVWTHNVASDQVAPGEYASIAAGASEVGLMHMVRAIWYTIDEGTPFEEDIELEQTLFEELAIVPLEYE